MRYLQSYSSFCKQYFGSSLSENHANISQSSLSWGDWCLTWTQLSGTPLGLHLLLSSLYFRINKAVDPEDIHLELRYWNSDNSHKF